MGFEGGALHRPKKVISIEEAPLEQKRSEGLTRRDLLRAAIASALVGAGAGVFLKPENEERLERSREHSEAFEHVVDGFKTLYGEAHFDEVVFLDSTGKAVGGPVRLEDIRTPEGVVSPGRRDYNGVIFPSRVPQEWYRTKAELLRQEHPDAASGDFTHRSTIGSLNEELTTKTAVADRPRLRETLTYETMVRRYAEQPSPEPGLDLLSYVRTHALQNGTESTRALPPAIVDELRPLIPAIAGQESHFDTTAASKDKQGDVVAVGLFQFRPKTFAAYFPNDTDSVGSVALQVEAVGKHFVSIYKHLTSEKQAGPALKKIRQQCFDGDEDSFQREFMVPVMVNCYNTGQGTLVKIINQFIKLHDGQIEARGYDVYDMMRKEAAHDCDRSKKDDIAAALEEKRARLYPGVDTYGSDSSEYVPRAYALKELLARA